MVMCIISACLCLPLLILSAIDLGIANSRRSYSWSDGSGYSSKLDDVLQGEWRNDAKIKRVLIGATPVCQTSTFPTAIFRILDLRITLLIII